MYLDLTYNQLDDIYCSIMNSTDNLRGNMILAFRALGVKDQQLLYQTCILHNHVELSVILMYQTDIVYNISCILENERYHFLIFSYRLHYYFELLTLDQVKKLCNVDYSNWSTKNQLLYTERIKNLILDVTSLEVMQYLHESKISTIDNITEFNIKIYDIETVKYILANSNHNIIIQDFYIRQCAYIEFLLQHKKCILSSSITMLPSSLLLIILKYKKYCYILSKKEYIVEAMMRQGRSINIEMIVLCNIPHDYLLHLAVKYKYHDVINYILKFE